MSLRTDATSSPQSDEAQARAIQQQNATLIWAATQGYETIVKTMLTTPGTNSLATDPTDAYVTPPLLLAAQKGHANTVSIMLEHSDANAVDKCNDTALIWAAHYNHIKVAQIILKHSQSNINTACSNGNTALLIAIANARHEIALELLKCDDIDLTKQNQANQTVFTFLNKIQNTPTFDAFLAACAK